MEAGQFEAKVLATLAVYLGLVLVAKLGLEGQLVITQLLSGNLIQDQLYLRFEPLVLR